jgi:hypothetical protein
MTLTQAFLEQAPHCRALGSPFMDRLLHLLADRWPEDTKVATLLSEYTGDIGPKGHSLPLRLCGGLHALCLSGQDMALAQVYPPNAADDDALWAAVETALRGHDDFWPGWLALPPQTNEVRRAAAMIATSALLCSRYDLPLRVSELGASAGLNLMFDRFHMQIADQAFGPASEVQLAPDWSGLCPAPATATIEERRGVDLNPLDAHTEDAQLRLLAYLWPDQLDRIQRTRAAIALNDVQVDQSDAIDWLSGRLPHQPGQVHLIYSTVAWQYFPADKQAEGTAMIEAAGQSATHDAPLAWMQMEADSETRGAALTLRLWPGDLHLPLGRIDFHGRWVDWTGPISLP